MKNEERKVHLVGSGIANLAAAVYLIKDGGFSGANIKIYEQDYVPGGCLDARGDPEKGYNMQGERMFEENYVCFYDLTSYIPSLEDPNKSVKEDTLAYWRTYPWNNKCRLVDKGKKLNADNYGLTPQHTLRAGLPSFRKVRPTWASPVSLSNSPTMSSLRWNIRCATARPRPSNSGISTRNRTRSST